MPTTVSRRKTTSYSLQIRILREANKSQLADELTKAVPNSDITKTRREELPELPEFQVLDGGSLLHRIQWAKDTSFENIAGAYAQHVKKNYKAASVTVVFDGYRSGASTKDMTHQRRSKGKVGPRDFTQSMPLRCKKETFLTNNGNTQDSIGLLATKLQMSDIQTLDADGDADLLIAKTGEEFARAGVTHVIGEDTDILVLLCHHAKTDIKGLYFCSDKTAGRY